jgi:hypothetical protein
MKKIFPVFLIAFIVSCTPEQKHDQSSSEDITCASTKMSSQQKADNNLFLNFYYGMTLKEFTEAQQEMLKSGQLIQYDSTGALPRPDTTVKFLLIVENNGPEKCYFSLVPAFEGCVLHAINLEYIPSYGLTAFFKESNKSQDVPDLTTADSIEKLYRKKYGKPSVVVERFMGGYNRYTWKSGSKNVELYKSFGTTQDMKGNDFRQISGIGLAYRSIAFDKKEKLMQDSVDTADKNRLLEIKKNQEKSI